MSTCLLTLLGVLLFALVNTVSNQSVSVLISMLCDGLVVNCSFLQPEWISNPSKKNQKVIEISCFTTRLNAGAKEIFYLDLLPSKMRLLVVFLSVFVFYTGKAQQAKVMVGGAASFSLSYTDAVTAPGYGIAGFVDRDLGKGFNVGALVQIDRVFGGPNVLTLNFVKDYNFRSTIAAVVPHIDYSLYLLPFDKLELRASLGVGGAIASTRGTFQNPSNGVRQYESWGEPMFYPIYEDGQIVNARTQKTSGFLLVNPAISVGYFVKHNVKVFVRSSYMLAQSDDLDAFNLPSPANQSKDIYQLNQFGIGYVIYKKRFFRP
jgi:hypothetical protein